MHLMRQNNYGKIYTIAANNIVATHKSNATRQVVGEDFSNKLLQQTMIVALLYLTQPQIRSKITSIATILLVSCN
jgi:hypothetical protein